MRTRCTLIVATAVLLAAAAPVAAATFDVDTVAEFQAALTTAQSNGEDDTINVYSGTYDLTAGLTYVAAAGENYALSIVGPSPHVTSLRAVASGFRLLQILTATAGTDTAANVFISGLSFRGGGDGGLWVVTDAAGIHLDQVVAEQCMAAEGGGALLGSASGTVVVERSVFENNEASDRGAGLWLGTNSSQVVIVNTILAYNFASGSTGVGGGMYLQVDAPIPTSLVLTNNTIVENTAGLSGGGVYYDGQGAATLEISNTIVRGNHANLGGDDGDDLWLETNGTAVGLVHDDVGDRIDLVTGFSEDLVVTDMAGFWHAGLVGDDPRLDGRYRLSEGSPCIDAGSLAATGLPFEDFERQDRTFDAAPDIGADEFFLSTLTVSDEIQLRDALINAAANGVADIIRIEPGVYAIGSPLTYSASLDESYPLILQPAGNGPVVLDGGGSEQILILQTNTAYAWGWPDVVVSGIHFTGGADPIGGAVYAASWHANLVFDGCTFTGNSAGGMSGIGGALMAQSPVGPVVVTGCTFDGNTVTSAGGGGAAYLAGGSALSVTGNLFAFNSAVGLGGALVPSVEPGGMLEMENNTFVANQATADAGNGGQGGAVWLGVYGDTADVLVANNLFADNLADLGGNDGDDLWVDTDYDGNGIGCFTTLVNNFLGPDADPVSGASEDLVITDLDNCGQLDNLTGDPLLDLTFHLTAGSSCIDAGAIDGSPTDYDIDGAPRVYNGRIDIGADEYTPSLIFADGFRWGDDAAWSFVVP